MPEITGTEGPDTLIGTSPSDIIRGLGGDDILRGTGSFFGGAGDDTILWTSYGTFDGGEGFDTVDVHTYVGGLTIGTNNAMIIRVGATPDTLEVVETFTNRNNMTRYETAIVATNVERLIVDGETVRLTGYARDIEVVALEAGNITTGSGRDRLQGSAASDTLDGGSGDDILLGGDGNDTLIGGLGDDAIIGGAGTDTAIFNITRDRATVTYEGGSIIVTSSQGRDVLTGVEVVRFFDENYDVIDGRLSITPRIQPLRLSGTDADDIITGGRGDDMLWGYGGNDILTGDPGLDIIDGGDGIDTVIYSGVRTQYTITSPTGTVWFIDGGPEGNRDGVYNVEYLNFVDGRLTWDLDSQAAQIYRLYDSALDRVGDEAGQQGLLDRLERGETLLNIAQTFLASAEFQARFGGLSNQAFVEQMYRTSLNRAPDANGLAAWTNALNAGTSRAQVLVSFSESAEHRQITASSIQSSGLWIADDRALSIARLYDAAFDRGPDGGGLSAWTTALRDGASLSQIAGAFAASQEFQQRYGALGDRAFVEQMYLFGLDRLGEPSGIDHWVHALQSRMTRADLLLIFSESAEHIAVTTPRWLGGIILQSSSSALEEAPLMLLLENDGADLPHSVFMDGPHEASPFESAHDWLLA